MHQPAYAAVNTRFNRVSGTRQVDRPDQILGIGANRHNRSSVYDGIGILECRVQRFDISNIRRPQFNPLAQVIGKFATAALARNSTHRIPAPQQGAAYMAPKKTCGTGHGDEAFWCL